MWCVIVETKIQTKIWNFKFEVLNNKISNIEFYFSKLQIWNFEIFLEIFVENKKLHNWNYKVSFWRCSNTTNSLYT